jgi:hypothetical protein
METTWFSAEFPPIIPLVAEFIARIVASVGAAEIPEASRTASRNCRHLPAWLPESRADTPSCRAPREGRGPSINLGGNPTHQEPCAVRTRCESLALSKQWSLSATTLTRVCLEEHFLRTCWIERDSGAYHGTSSMNPAQRELRELWWVVLRVASHLSNQHTFRWVLQTSADVTLSLKPTHSFEHAAGWWMGREIHEHTQRWHETRDFTDVTYVTHLHHATRDLSGSCHHTISRSC